MATTNNFSLPYPQGNDPYNIPEDIANLAKSIDSSLKAVSDSVATLDYSTTETVEEVQRNLEILEQEINRAGLPNVEQIMVDIEEARKELEATKEEFSVGQAELGVHLTNLRDERMPALEASVQEARNEMDTAMDEFMSRQTQFEDSISTAEEDIAEAKRRLGQNEEDIATTKQDVVEALEGEVDHDRLRVGTGGFDEVFAREVVSGIIGAEKAEVIDLIAEDLIANNATIINAALQNLTVTERANFVEAFAKELYAERFTAEVANIANLTVAARNLIPGMFNIANEVPPPFDVSDFGVNTGDPSVWIQGPSTVSTSSEEDALIYLEAGVNYKFSVETAASVPGTMYYVQLIDENGDTASDTVVELTETSYLLSQEIAGPNKSNWWPAESTFWVQNTGGYRLKIYANHNNGADNLDGYQWFRNMRVENMNDGRLIVPNSIDASRLNAHEIFSNQLVAEQIYSNIIRTKLLEAEEALIGGANIKDDEITVGKLTALDEILTEMLKVRKIDAGDIAADAITAGKIAGNAIDGKTITGATVRTSSSGKRVEMRNNAVTAYDSSNRIQARYSGDGIELRPPGGSLTEIGPHIFGSEVITRATNQPWVNATTIAEGGNSSWGTFLTNATNSVAFPMVSHRYVFDFTFMYMPGGGNMHESYAAVLSNIQIATSSSNAYTVMERVFHTRGWYSNTDYQLTYTTSATLPSSRFSIGDMIYPRFRFRSRSVNFGATVHSFIFKATPA